MAWPFRQLCATSRWMQHLDCWCPPPSQSAGRPCVTERHSRGSECTGVHFQVTHFILSPRTSQLVCCIPTAASPSKLALWVARLAVWRYHSPAATSLDRHHLSSTPRPVPLPGSFWHPHPPDGNPSLGIFRPRRTCQKRPKRSILSSRICIHLYCFVTKIKM